MQQKFYVVFIFLLPAACSITTPDQTNTGLTPLAQLDKAYQFEALYSGLGRTIPLIVAVQCIERDTAASLPNQCDNPTQENKNTSPKKRYKTHPHTQ